MKPQTRIVLNVSYTFKSEFLRLMSRHCNQKLIPYSFQGPNLQKLREHLIALVSGHSNDCSAATAAASQTGLLFCHRASKMVESCTGAAKASTTLQCSWVSSRNKPSKTTCKNEIKNWSRDKSSTIVLECFKTHSAATIPMLVPHRLVCECWEYNLSFFILNIWSTINA